MHDVLVGPATNLGDRAGFYGIPASEVVAITEFLRRVTVPIFGGEDAKRFVGTGTLFRVADRNFIVTARHIFDGMPNPAEFACPENPDRGEIWSLAKIDVARPQREDIDVAVVELKSLETIARMQSGWQFLTLSNIRAPHERGVFLLSGFPLDLSANRNGKVLAPLATVYSERLPSVPDDATPPVDPTLDLFFAYDTTGVALDRRSFSAPSLKGTSGGSVWEYSRSRTAVWSPESAIKVVAIQSAFMRGRFFRAMNWGAVAEVFKRIDEPLAEAILSQLTY